jgi:hypothetical protein
VHPDPVRFRSALAQKRSRRIVELSRSDAPGSPRFHELSNLSEERVALRDRRSLTVQQRAESRSVVGAGKIEGGGRVVRRIVVQGFEPSLELPRTGLKHCAAPPPRCGA